MITTNTNTLGAPAEMQIALEALSGRFGLFYAEDAPVCEDLNSAIVGYVSITPDTHGNPQSGELAYGNVQTLDSLGAGADGRKVIPETGGAKEWITQVAFMADGSLYSRIRVNNNAFQSWVKRW
ncbi:hypothetical protein Q1B84_001523 [Salmonella enterica]|uniref:hypothetical protein n=1 Tax=Salmonella enterica TaxID=28901 RepID=UPI001EDD3B47|nr:hypothetical protein [Salmonella enterica]EEM6320239.1 hypothetical protein [Salmonella enterica]EJE9921052.1 hypothetical protein [Salmonella enterica]EKC8051825.1 hypothetical protein [Salmonella enterica]EKL5246235.1 hypothetical protein [Salmonella enterica]MCG3493698.1 hypothetical protein [Salmonella enterica subsp. diarizonae]